MGESEDVGLISHIVEGDDAGFIVQENPHALWGLFEAEGGLRGRESFILIPATLSHKPVAIGRRGRDLPFPAYRLTTHSKNPFGLLTHVHFPVVTASCEVLGAQDADNKVKPLWVVRNRPFPVSEPHTSPILRQDEFGMCRVRVQGNSHCRELERGEKRDLCFKGSSSRFGRKNSLDVRNLSFICFSLHGFLPTSSTCVLDF